ncbi:hypothetical protein ACH5RR_030010 [Cinchona calisaya]|uniref:Uncharacterized protein n=1 Tax=Cinchona calisaya TaxID=153742 RepID=A0ABD2YWI2_9GENT
MPSAVIGIFIFTSIFLVGSMSVRKPHVINFGSHNLFPESFDWDPKNQHFIVGSLRHPTLLSVSDAGDAETLISDSSLPHNSSILGITLDHHRRRILAAVHLPSSLAAYELSTGPRRIIIIRRRQRCRC